MAAPFLIISDPPHGGADASSAVPYFGLSAAEIQMKANYPIPEIWFADEDERRLAPAADALRDTGFSIALTSGRAIAETPSQSLVTTFDFADTGLRIIRDDAEEEITFKTPILGVFCVPLAPPPGPSGTSAADILGQRTSYSFSVVASGPGAEGEDPALAIKPFLDLYVLGDPPRRLAFIEGTTDFSMFDTQVRRANDGLLHLVAECQSRFAQAIIDRRCVAMKIRRSVVVTGQTAALSPRRSGFSYATTALKKLLGSITPDLATISQPELSSRLVFLTHRAELE